MPFSFFPVLTSASASALCLCHVQVCMSLTAGMLLVFLFHWKPVTRSEGLHCNVYVYMSLMDPNR